MSRVLTEDISLRQPCCLETLAQTFRCHWILFWSLVSVSLAGGHFLVAIWRGGPDNFWPAPVIVSVMFGWACIEIIWSQHKLVELEAPLADMVEGEERASFLAWYGDRIRLSYDANKMVALGLLILLACLTIYFIIGLGFWHRDPVIVTYDLVIYSSATLVLGMSQWPFYNISLTVTQLGRLPLRPQLYRHPSSNILAIGNFLLRVWLGGLGLILLAEIVFMIVPVRGRVFVQIVLSLVSAGAIVWFLVVQQDLHELMVSDKRERMNHIAAHIEDSLSILQRRYDSGVYQQLRELKEVYEDFKGQPEWPFDTATFLKFVSASVSPIVTFVLQFAFHR